MGKHSKIRSPRKAVEDLIQDEILMGGNSEDIVIPVMGPTGAGKSHVRIIVNQLFPLWQLIMSSRFINSLLGRKEMVVGHNLASCTVALKPVVIDNTVVASLFPDLKGRRLIIVDTPGFDDTVRDDSEVLKRIASWLAQSYTNSMKLGGIIYLHDISQNRMTGANNRNLVVFQKFCGVNAYKSIVLGSTQWSQVEKKIGQERHEQLKDVFWKQMIDGGSHVIPVNENDPWELVRIILKGGIVDTLLTIQNELVELGKIIPETEAAKALKRNIDEAIKAGGISDTELRQLIEEAKRLKIPLSRQILGFFGL